MEGSYALPKYVKYYSHHQNRSPVQGIFFSGLFTARKKNGLKRIAVLTVFFVLIVQSSTTKIGSAIPNKLVPMK